MFVYDAACFYVHICVFVRAVCGYANLYLRLLAHLYLLFPCHASSGACLLYLWGPRYLRAWQRGYFWTARTFSVGPRSRARSRVNLELGFEIKRTSWWRRRPEQVGTTRANIGFWLWFALRQHLLSWEESKHPWASRNIFKDKTTTQLFSLIILTEHYVTTSQTDVWRADIQKSLSLRLGLDIDSALCFHLLLFVCWLGSQHDCTKTTWKIATKLGLKTGLGQRITFGGFSGWRDRSWIKITKLPG